MKSASPARVIIDRIEGDLAVLVLYEDDRVRFNFPLRLLPEGACEGDHLRMTFAEDNASRESEKKRIGNLLDELKSK
jgi:DUF3006 family protein